MSIGKKVIIYGSRFSQPTIEVVEGETKTSWRVKGNLYRKDTLYLRGASVWNMRRIEFAGNEKITKVKHESLLHNIRNKIKNFDVDDLSESQLSRIDKILKEKAQ